MNIEGRCAAESLKHLRKDGLIRSIMRRKLARRRSACDMKDGLWINEGLVC
jgi:hypothetical protein